MDRNADHRDFIAMTRALARDIGNTTPSAIEAQLALLDLAEVLEAKTETPAAEVADAAMARAQRPSTQD